jgi:hypothetical protein
MNTDTKTAEREPDTDRDREPVIEFCNSCDSMLLPGGYCNCR